MLLFFFLYLVFMYQYGRLIFCQVISYLRNNFIFLFFISSLRNLVIFSVICENLQNNFGPKKNRSQCGILPIPKKNRSQWGIYISTTTSFTLPSSTNKIALFNTSSPFTKTLLTPKHLPLGFFTLIL